MEKRFTGLILLIALIFSGCGGTGSSDTDKVPVPPSSMFMVRNYHFCSDQETDRFLLGYYGNQLPDTLVYFYIVNSGGDTLYRDDWPSVDMVPDHSEPNDDVILEAMRNLIDVKPVEGEVCEGQGPTYSYVGKSIGYCAAQKEVIAL